MVCGVIKCVYRELFFSHSLFKIHCWTISYALCVSPTLFGKLYKRYTRVWLAHTHKMIRMLPHRKILGMGVLLKITEEIPYLSTTTYPRAMSFSSFNYLLLLTSRWKKVCWLMEWIYHKRPTHLIRVFSSLAIILPKSSLITFNIAPFTQNDSQILNVHKNFATQYQGIYLFGNTIFIYHIPPYNVQWVNFIVSLKTKSRARFTFDILLCSSLISYLDPKFVSFSEKQFHHIPICYFLNHFPFHGDKEIPTISPIDGSFCN